MKLEHEFYKLPLKFNVDALRKELEKFTELDWRGHPSDYQGNLAIPLISVNGEINNIFAGPMKPTQHLNKAPYMSQVISSFKSVIGRSRLMRLEPNSEVPIHSDFNYHWYSRVRIHVPITSTPDIIFYCGDQQVHMAPGEAWIFDSWKMHRVVNPTQNTRVHLVIDTTGSPEFWNMCKRGSVITSSNSNSNLFEDPEFIEYSRKDSILQTENFNVPMVMAPGEMDALVGDIVNDAKQCVKNDIHQFEVFEALANSLKQAWRSIWSLHGHHRSGWKDYESLILETEQQLSLVNRVGLCNGCNASQVLFARVLKPAYHPELAVYYDQNKWPIDQTGEENPIVKLQTENKRTEKVLSDTGIKKTGRNNPCPCGSGKKYKKCHGM